MRAITKKLWQPLASDYWKRRVLAPEIAESNDIARALRAVRARWPETTAADEVRETPIFLFAAGWGSGSTLLQRIIMSDQQTMLWGEPHDHAVPVCRLAQMIAPIDDRWPRANYFAPPDSDAPLSEQWIANLSPKIISLQSAHRQFLRSWLREPAEQAGRSRWGLKEVRLTADHARYLQWLFPQAKFVFLYRDVLNSFLSCRDVKWFSVWPHYRVSRVSSFAHHWVHLVTGFLDAQSEINAHVISYEDLVEGRASLGALAAYLDSAAFDKSVLQVRVGARGARQERLSFREAATLDAIAGPLRARLGYS